MFKFITTLFYTVLIALLVSVAGLLVGTMLPIPGNIEVKIVKSGSMHPAIPTGSVVVVKPAAEYRFNDVITFGADTKTSVPTTHRIIGVHGSGKDASYTVKGDANEEADEEQVARREVIGKVIFSLPYAGFVLDFARQPIGFTLLIAIPAALVILEEVLTIFKEARRWTRKRREDDSPDGGNTPADAELMFSNGRIVATKRRSMDEIFIPMAIDLKEQFKKRMQERAPDSYGMSAALVMCLVFASSLFSGASGGTIAYFQDIEKSLGNVFAAASCDDFRPGSCDIEEVTIESEEQALLVATTSPEGDVAGASDVNEEEKQPEPSGGGSGTTTPDAPPAEPEGTENATSTDDVTPEPAQTAPIEPVTGSTPPEPDAAQMGGNEPLPPADDPPAEPQDSPPASEPETPAGDPEPAPEPSPDPAPTAE